MLSAPDSCAAVGSSCLVPHCSSARTRSHNDCINLYRAIFHCNDRRSLCRTKRRRHDPSIYSLRGGEVASERLRFDSLFARLTRRCELVSWMEIKETKTVALVKIKLNLTQKASRIDFPVLFYPHPLSMFAGLDAGARIYNSDEGGRVC